MQSAEMLNAFVITTAIFAFVPGPAMLYAAGRTLAGGRRCGLMAALGIHLGGYFHVLAASAGLSIAFHAVPSLYVAVKLVGAVYLVWLGIALFRSRHHAEGLLAEPGAGRPAFVESVWVEVFNPKTALFFLAFLPQFTDPASTAPVWLQFLVLGTIVNLIFSSGEILCVLLASAVMARLMCSGQTQRWLQRAGGSILVGLGAHLALHPV